MIEYTVRVFKNQTKWFLNGKLHREDGPAIEVPDGYEQWWLNGELHREGGPAVEYSNGHKAWWFNGKRHREDGPAVEWINGNKEWWLNGEEFSEEEYWKKVNEVKELTVAQIEELLGHKVKVIKG